MTPEVLFIRRAGRSTMRVLVFRVDRRRRARIARALARRGFPLREIGRMTGLTETALSRVLAWSGSGIWGRHAGAIKTEMARLA